MALLDEAHRSVALCDFVDYIIYIRRGCEIDPRQIVGLEVAVAPMAGKEAVACASCRGRLLQCHQNACGEVNAEGV